MRHTKRMLKILFFMLVTEAPFQGVFLSVSMAENAFGNFSVRLVYA